MRTFGVADKGGGSEGSEMAKNLPNPSVPRKWRHHCEPLYSHTPPLVHGFWAQYFVPRTFSIASVVGANRSSLILILHQCSMTNHYFGIVYCLYRLFSIYWGTHPHTRTPLCAVFGHIFLSPDNRARARGMTVALYDVILPRQLSRAAAAVNIWVGEMHQCEPLAFP